MCHTSSYTQPVPGGSPILMHLDRMARLYHVASIVAGHLPISYWNRCCRALALSGGKSGRDRRFSLCVEIAALRATRHSDEQAPRQVVIRREEKTFALFSRSDTHRSEKTGENEA
jgi:hypothetical protein